MPSNPTYRGGPRPGARALRWTAAGVLALCAPPLFGVWLAGLPLARYLQFPPKQQYIAHAAPSAAAMVLFAVLGAAALGALLFVLWPRTAAPVSESGAPSRRRGEFPWWGWLALAALALSWLFAWTRWAALSGLQSYSFVPLWLSYIALVNALTRRRTGTCLACRRRGLFLALFPASAVFWWYFEYLNRFVQNWQYTGVDVSDALGYGLHATLAFSTVLPAVASTQELLATFGPLRHGWSRAVRVEHSRAVAALVLLVSLGALLALGVRPNLLFPTIWLAPLGILLALQTLAAPHGEARNYLAPLAAGRWEVIYLPALAALTCGVFWEMWNEYSAAKWVYHIAFVERWKVFEMPLLGYLGYLPFGVQCAVVIDLVRGALSAQRDADDDRR